MTKFKMQESVENAFIAGLLLTGSVERAETAVLESVRMSCSDDLFSESLFRRTVHYSIDQQAHGKGKPGELDQARSILPFELRCILGLSKQLRYCYVLRMLIGLPRDVCAWLLHVDTSKIDQQTCAAMLELPQIQLREQCSSMAGFTKNLVARGTTISSARRASRTKLPDHTTPVAFFTSTRIIQFNKQAENF